MFPIPRNAVASSSRLPPPTLFLQARSVQYDASGRLAGLTQRPELPTTVFLGKVPNFYGDAAIRHRFDKHGVHIKEVYVPHPKNIDGKRRANNRGFAFMEVESEEDQRKALAISQEKIGFFISPSRQTIEEARSYSEWAFNPVRQKELADAKKPLKEWQVLELEKQRRMGGDGSTKWD